MNRLRRCLAIPCLALLLPAAGCGRVLITVPPSPAPKDYARQLPPGASALRKITDPTRLPALRAALPADRRPLRAALDHSIRYFGYPSSRTHYPLQGITHARAAQSLIAFREILDSAQTAAEFERRVLAAFDLYQSVGCDDAGTVLFTGYYTPVFDARRAPDAVFRWPLHKLPPDLVKARDGRCLGRRRADGAIVPYYSRAEIVNGALKGHELLYLKNRFEAYVCTVQGSAKLRLAGGEVVGVGYHGNNGWPYTSVGHMLVRDGRLAPDKLSLSRLIRFFTDHPGRMDEYLPRNERYVFFRETRREPTGSLGLPVTPGCSIATDKRVYPRACLVLVDTRVPRLDVSGQVEQAPFLRFALDQDTGGAIRAPGRADIYLGVGDDAGRIAGGTLAEGRLYYFFLKDDAPAAP